MGGPQPCVVLSLFPGIGLLDKAFEEFGFCIVRGPDLLWGGDVRRFHPPAGRFDGLIGGPPCQLFSAMKRLNPKAGERHGNLIPEFERCVAEAQPRFFLMENVPAAPIPSVPGYHVHAQLVEDVLVGGLTSRLRRFSFGTRDGRLLRVSIQALHPMPEPAVLAGGSGRSVPVAIGGSGKRKRTAAGQRHGPHDGPRAPLSVSLRAQGLPADFLDECPLTVEGKRHAIGNGVRRGEGERSVTHTPAEPLGGEPAQWPPAAAEAAGDNSTRERSEATPRKPAAAEAAGDNSTRERSEATPRKPRARRSAPSSAFTSAAREPELASSRALGERAKGCQCAPRGSLGPFAPPGDPPSRPSPVPGWLASLTGPPVALPVDRPALRHGDRLPTTGGVPC